MQRLGSSWLLNRQVTARHQHVLQIIRHASIKAPWPRGKIRRGAPSFNVGSLLLDLDAEDAKHVRQFDPDLDGEPEHRMAKRNRADDAIDARISQFEETLRRGRSRFEMMVQRRLYELHINDLDILSTALSGPMQKDREVTPEFPNTALSPEENKLEETLHYITNEVVPWNGIPQYATQDDKALATYMFYQQKKAKDLGALDLTKDAAMTTLENFSSGEISFFELKRAIQFFLDTPDGAQVVSDISEQLGQCIRETINDNSKDTFDALISTPELLIFTNNIVLNLLTRNLPVGKALWSAGLLLAIYSSAFSAVRMHITAAFASGHEKQGSPDCLVQALRWVLDYVEAPPKTLSPAIPILPSWHRRGDIFDLMTGHDVSRHLWQSSFQHWMENAPPSAYHSFAVYLQILGELGALNTVWYIYKHLAELFPTLYIHKSSTDKRERTKLDPFLDAIRRILWNVKSGRLSLKASHRQKPVDSFDHAIQLDSDLIRRSSRFATKVDPAAADRSGFNVRSRTMEEDILKALDEYSIQDAIPAIQKLLVRL